MKPPPADEDSGQCGGMSLPSGKHSLCTVACTAATNDLRQALYAIASADVALLLLPLALLTAAAPSDEGCGWTPQALDVHCAVALALLWLSLVITAAQLVAISAAGPLRRALFVYRLWWHLPASLIGTAIGGAVGVYALSGYLALVRGDCGSGSTGVLFTSVGIGILVVAVYVYISRVEARAVEGADFKDGTQRLLSMNPEHPEGAELKEDKQASLVQNAKADEAPALVSIVPTSDGKASQEVGVGSLSISAVGMENVDEEIGAQGNVERDRHMAATGAYASAGPAGGPAPPGYPPEAWSNRNTAAADAAAGGSASEDNTAHSSAGAGMAAGAADAGAGRNGRRGSREKRHSQSSNQVTPVVQYGSERSSSSRASPQLHVPHLVLTMPGNPVGTLPGPTPEAVETLETHQPMVSSWGSARSSGQGRDGRRRSDNFSHHEHRRRKSAEGKTHKRTSWCVGTVQTAGWSLPVVQTLTVPSLAPGSDRPKTIAPSNTVILTPNQCEPVDKKRSTIETHFEGTFTQRRRSLLEMDDEEQEEVTTDDSPSEMSSSRKGKRESQITFQEPDVTEFTVKNSMRRCSRRPASPTFDAIVFMSGQNPINFENLMERDDSDMEDESGSEPDSDGDEDAERPAPKQSREAWKHKSQPKVEVPFWLMERLQSRGQPPQEESEETPTDSPKSAEGEKKKKIKTRPSTPDRDTSQSKPRRLSNQDAEVSEKKEGSRKNGSNKTDAKKGLDQSKLNPSPVIMPSNTFWKIPMPTRKNTMMIQVPTGASAPKQMQSFTEGEGEEEDEEDGEGIASDEDLMSSDSQASKGHPLDSGSDFEEGMDSGENIDSGDELAPNPPGVAATRASPVSAEDAGRRVSFSDQQLGIALPKYSEDKYRKRLGAITEDDDDEIDLEADPLARPMAMPAATLGPKRAKNGSRRPSVLGIFSDDSAKAEGLYMLPKHQDNTSEVVEVRRSSLVMSTAMLNDILKQKVSKDGDSQRLQGIGEDCEDCPEQVVLPFFTPPQKGGRTQCQCKTDPMTGFVIHTCMTPSTTQATNTGAMASYLCSEWGSRRHSTAASRSSKSRRNSGDLYDGEEDDVPTSLVPPPPKPNAGAPNRKRIRNASMLAVVGGQGPVAAKKVEPEEEEKQDNELAVSVKNIQAVAAAVDQIPDGEVNFLKDGTSKDKMDELASKEQRVEADLGHKFELVEPYVLAGMLKDPEVREQLLTVDVRGRDWVGGHIPSSINLRTSEVVENPFQLLVQCRRNRVHHIIFTCMYSVLRARKCAVAVEKAQEQEKQAGNSPYRLRISLLAGGMHAWINHFMKTQHDTPPKCYIDGFEPDMWSDGGPSQGGLVHVMDALWSSGGQKALSDALSQELEALLMTRRSSQQSSRRESVASNTTPEQRRGSGASASETPITPEMAAEQLMQARHGPRRGSGAEGQGQPVGQFLQMTSGSLPGLVNPPASRESKQDSDSNADSDMT